MNKFQNDSKSFARTSDYDVNKDNYCCDDEELLQSLSQLNLSGEFLEPEKCKSLIPKCIKMFVHKDLKLRAEAVGVVIGQLRFGNQEMAAFCEDLCWALKQEAVMIPKEEIADDKTEDFTYLMKFQRGLSSIISMLHWSHADVLMKHFKPICEYIVLWTGSDDVKQALAGCEFWAKLSVPPVPPAVLERWIHSVFPKLPFLLSYLLRCIIYHDQHADFLETYGSTTVENSHEVPMTPAIERYSNIRNYAALGFENICRIFQSDVVPLFKPYVQTWIQSENWREVEASVLALSAFTEAMGIPQSMLDVFSAVIPKILEFFFHPKPLIRSIACFSMPHFVNIAIKGVKNPTAKTFRYTSNLLKDDCHEVRSIAIRSLATIIAYTKNDVRPYVNKIIEDLVNADHVMTGESRCVYFECIGHLFGRAGSLLQAKDVDRLIKPLIQQWNLLEWNGRETYQNDDVSIVRLCQALCIIANFSKSIFEPYAPDIFEKAALQLEKIIISISSEGQGDAIYSDIVTGYLVAYLDLISAIFDGQGNLAFKLAQEHSLAGTLYKLLSNPLLHNKVHQSSLALLGHIAKHATEPTDPKLDSFLDIIGSKIAKPKSELATSPLSWTQNTTDEIMNNALWALVFIAKDPMSDKERIFGLVDDLIRIFKQTDAHSGCIVNAAWALTNMCALWPKQTIGVIVKEDVFLHLCCLLQSRFPCELEKIEVFKNLCTVVSCAIGKIQPNFWAQFLIAAALITTTDENLQHSLQTVIHEIRATLGISGWNKVSEEIGPQMSYTLRKRYKLY